MYITIQVFGAQAHFSQLELPISDYVTDLKSVLDQSIRIIQAMIDICANSGWLSSSITCMRLLQMIMQVFFPVLFCSCSFFILGNWIVYMELDRAILFSISVYFTLNKRLLGFC